MHRIRSNQGKFRPSGKTLTLALALCAGPSGAALAQVYPGTSPGTAVPPGGGVSPVPGPISPGGAPTAPLPGSGGTFGNPSGPMNPNGAPNGPSGPLGPGVPGGAATDPYNQDPLGSPPGGLPSQPGSPANPLSPQMPGAPANPLSPRSPGGLGAPGTPGSGLPGGPTH